jgi:CheY-like chemotaxis protein
MPQKRILVVDDDIISQNMLRSTLADAGYSAVIASGGEEGLRKAQETPFDLIILDIMMPGMDGGEVANLLRTDPRTEKIPIVFLSSLISEDEEKIGTRKDLRSFLSKPYNRDKLLNEIGRYLRRENSHQ